MSAARHRGERADRGAGLPEVMVGVAIFALLTGLLATFSINMLRTGNGVNNRVTNVNDLRVAMDEISKGLRVAVRPEQVGTACPTCDVALYAATTNEVSFYANQAGAPRLTIYRVEKDTDPTAVPNTGRLVALNKPAGTVAALSDSTVRRHLHAAGARARADMADHIRRPCSSTPSRATAAPPLSFPHLRRVCLRPTPPASPSTCAPPAPATTPAPASPRPSSMPNSLIGR